MVATRIEAKGLDKIQKHLSEMMERAKNLSPVLEVVAAAIKTEIDNSFRRSTAPDGTAWEPLKQSTVQKRRKASSKPLVDTGTLRGGAFARADGNSIVFGDNVKYAGTHQFGADIERQLRHGPKQKTGPKLGPVSPARRKAANKARRTKLGPRVNFQQHGPGNRDLYAQPIGPRWQNNNQRAAQQGASARIHIPARPFLPVKEDGSLIPIKAIATLSDRVREYIRTGKKG